MSGRLIAIVGPSGVGKDTVMSGLQQRMPRLQLVRRVITRPAGAGGEAFLGVTEAEFLAMVDAGAFALHWQAHGLRYGIPVEVQAKLAAGQDLLINLSRGVLSDASRVFPQLTVINLTAPRAVLAARLAARGRESAARIAARLERDVPDFEQGLPVTHMRNDRDIDLTLDEIEALLRIAQAER